MTYKYQVIEHKRYYPTSALFETYEQALEFYQTLDPDELVTLCEIKEHKGVNTYCDVIEWY
jgi:hypothetical protein